MLVGDYQITSAKLCKDTGIVGKSVTTTDVDIIFSKYKP